jgi:hypothetical protein
MESREDVSQSTNARQRKVDRLIEEYDLEGFGAELERLWTAETDRRSLRELAGQFNRRLLEVTLEEANVQILDGELENIYRLLTDEDVSGADRTRIRRQLERDGVDVDALTDDFVTYQSIRTYLKEDRGAEYAPSQVDPIEREVTNVQQLRGRVVSVTEGKLEQLRGGDELELGEFRMLVDVRVVCEDCNTQFDVLELLERGGCDCNGAADGS